MFKSRYEVEEDNLDSKWLGGSHNKVRVERTGYVPLSVRIKQFTIAGLQMSLQAKQYDFNDYKEIYHELDSINLYDDIETQQEKLNNYYHKLYEVQLRKQHSININNTASFPDSEPDTVDDDDE